MYSNSQHAAPRASVHWKPNFVRKKPRAKNVAMACATCAPAMEAGTALPEIPMFIMNCAEPRK